jgi:hypothetical protein
MSAVYAVVHIFPLIVIIRSGCPAIGGGDGTIEMV